MTLTTDITTDATIKVLDGYTLNGNGHKITAVDPDGGAFVGAVVENEGTAMYVKNLTVTVKQCRAQQVRCRQRRRFHLNVDATIIRNTVTGSASSLVARPR